MLNFVIMWTAVHACPPLSPFSQDVLVTSVKLLKQCCFSKKWNVFLRSQPYPFSQSCFHLNFSYYYKCHVMNCCLIQHVVMLFPLCCKDVLWINSSIEWNEVVTGYLKYELMWVCEWMREAGREWVRAEGCEWVCEWRTEGGRMDECEWVTEWGWQ